MAIVCGSGLAGMSNLLEERIDVPYDKIDGFQISTGACVRAERAEDIHGEPNSVILYQFLGIKANFRLASSKE